uniref:HECT domain-containing protein n=1 Tax=Anolis carolinensis TaxID=28377 RepID=G1KN06_ANOCA|nr:PREDICTED: probable E3 ubiquitin-protein ligase HERC6 [Anolis carolinensis]|eukprot:XP_008109241.1 PREDICTED: probable E3 ubiquitin-protein ligase HERC6 [Anolis carolinensis]
MKLAASDVGRAAGRGGTPSGLVHEGPNGRPGGASLGGRRKGPAKEVQRGLDPGQERGAHLRGERMLYCWGEGSAGQLGLGKGEGVSGPVPFRPGPRAPADQAVVLVACGERHTLLLRDDGGVASCGDNSRGQLGRRLPSGQEKRSYGPELIQALETQKVVHVSCGKEHSLAVCNKGRVYSWGAGTFGQLGTGELGDRLIPKTINALSKYKVIQVACGHDHSIALTNDGRIFSWGQNIHGQLGLGKDISSQASPQQVSALDGIPLAQVAAGGAHSFALSLSGVVYGWGRNNAHQLGLSQAKPKEQIFKPYSIAALRSLDVAFVSCGAEHTAVLTQNGSVYTFGDDSAGQLGRNSSSSPKFGPQKVEWIDGPVSLLACGSYHTLVRISTSGQLLSFGRGPLQRNRSGTTQSKPDGGGCLNISALVSPNELVGMQVKQIFAGTYVNFATVFHTQVSAYRNETLSMEPLPRISRLEEMQIDMWLSATAESEKRQNAKREIETIFSSSPCLTASFLKQGSPFKSGCCVAINLEKAKKIFENLATRDWIAGRISFCLLNYLIPALPLNSPHQEALSIFLLLPECSAALEAQKMQSLALPFAKAVLGLSKRSSEILENYWSLLPASSFDQIVQMLSRAVKSQLSYYNFYPQCQEVIPLLEVLKKLYKVNKKADYKLQIRNFYIDDINKIINTFLDLGRWHTRKTHPNPESFPVSLCSFPFVYNLLTKMEIFAMETIFNQECMKVGAHHEIMLNRMQRSSELPKLPVFLLRVQRQNLVENTLHKLSHVEDISLKMQLLVEFEGEMSRFEAGGVLLEFFSHVFEDMVQPDYGMFMYPHPSSPMWFCTRKKVSKNKYYLFGILCGLAMFNRVIAYVPFPLAAFKKLLDKKPTLDDLKELDPVLGRSLQAVLDYECDDIEENFQLCFSIFWDDVKVDLIPNGNSIAVNNSNKKDFVNKYVDYIFNISVNEVFGEFKRGFYKVLDKCIIDFFEPPELMELAIGNANYDWELYEKNAVYWGIYSPTHPTIKMFWKVFHELPLTDKKSFLLFVAGTDRVPPMGMNSLRITIHSHRSLSEDHIPEAQICFHLLLLPPFSTIGKLKEKLQQAIENNRGFGKQENENV